MIQTNAVTDRVREIVAQLSPIGASEQPAATALLVDDLGYDSLAIFELVLELERELELPRLQEEEALDMATVADVERLVVAALDPPVGRS